MRGLFMRIANSFRKIARHLEAKSYTSIGVSTALIVLSKDQSAEGHVIVSLWLLLLAIIILIEKPGA